MWFGLLPAPLGPGQPLLAVVACLPLLLPSAGVIRLKHRSLVWGGFLLLLYFIVGVMEAWSNPPQRAVALVQATLPVIYLLALRQYTRDA